MPVGNPRPIIWQSEDRNITLIDVPCSIAAAQGTQDQPCHDLLSSTQAQAEPYKTNEPKSAAARSRLVSNTVDTEYHEVYADLLNDSLSVVRAAYDGPWCQPRPFIETPKENGRKRKVGLNTVDDLTGPEGGTNNLYQSLHPQLESQSNVLRTLSQQSFSIIHGLEHTESQSYQSRPTLDDDTRASFSVTSPEDCDAFNSFFLPLESSFILSSCSDSRTLHTSVRAQAQELEVSKKFDFILLDPPWPNRSVKRTHKTAYSTYSTAQSLDEINQLIAGMDLDVLMADSCLVAIWITNKPAVRDLVLGENGLFDCWGVELTEEWVWLKTTVHGEPVTPMDSVWRKPYEILLLGRKCRQYVAPVKGLSTRQQEISRKVLVSVPDLHSRKPCLKELIEPLVPDRKRYRALEVFARHLVSGWWSWGDECIKFNGNQYWWRQCNASDKEEDIDHA
jgi:N6-adenosine-specific RNA methylase IME4